MAHSLKARIVKAEYQLARELAETRFSPEESREIRDGARDYAVSLGSGAARVEYLGFLSGLLDMASEGGAAVEMTGENIVYNYLHFTFKKLYALDSTFYRVIEDADPVIAENDKYGIVVTRDDARALIAIFNADKRQDSFDADDAGRKSLRQVEDALADNFRFYDGDTAGFYAMADVYAAGLEENWDDMTLRERGKALDAFNDGDPLPRGVARSFLGEPDFQTLIAAARENGASSDDGGSDDVNAQVQAILDAQLQWSVLQQTITPFL